MISNEDFIAFLRKNIILVACAVVAIAICVALYMRSDMLPEANNVLAQKSQEGELLAANIEDSNQLKEQHAALVESNQAISDRMIHVGQLADNLEYFYHIESETGAKLPDIHQLPWLPPARSAPKTNFTPIGFSVTAQGSYNQVLSVLLKLENGEHYCRVLTCNIHPSSEMRGGQMTMILSLELLGVP